MATPHDDPSPFQNYGSVHEPENPMPHSSLLPRSSRCSTASYPDSTAGEQQYSPLQQKTNNNLRDPEAGRRISRRLAVGVVCGLAFLAGSGVSWSRSSGSRSTAAAAGGFFEVAADTGIPAAEVRPSDPSSVPAGDDADNDAVLEFTALNFYHVRDGKPGQDYPWLKELKLIEPHRDTTLAVVGAREGFDYRWKVYSGSSSGSDGAENVQATATGAVTIVVLTELDENVIVLEEVDGDGKVTNRLEEIVMVKYVRREIRTLTEDEREELLDAMYTLWAVRVDGGDGKELYGEDYADIYAINRLHFKAATTGTCDHFHDGMGFMVSHSLITNTFEYSLQQVNPKFAMPYWDFTIDTTAATNLEYDQSKPSTRSELYDAAWFGTADPVDSVVKDGRWAYTEVPMGKAGNPGSLVLDVYGRLRSPWNTNDRAYITRAMGEQCQTNADEYLVWPTCRVHYEFITTNSDFYSWVWESMSGPHGPVHFWTGGAFGCESTYTSIAALVGDETADTLALLASGHRKGLYGLSVWTCTREAYLGETADELMSSGTCGCHGYDLTQGDDYKTVMDAFAFLEYFIGDHSEDIQRQVVSLLCSGVVSFGDQAQSSSSLDPMFWPIHGTIERMYQFGVVTETITEFNWPDGDVTTILADGTSSTRYVSSDSEDCLGHHGSHIFPYGLLDSDIDGFDVKTGIRSNPVFGNVLTNREVLEAFDPRSNSLNYIYDTFKWEHCGPEGYDFDDAWIGSTVPSAEKEFYIRDEPRTALYTDFKRMMAQRMKDEEDQLKEERREASSG